MKEQENEGKTQSEASYVAFINWESSNKSKISDPFYGQEMSTLTCTTCRHSSIRFDMICALVVPIPNVVHHCRLQVSPGINLLILFNKHGHSFNNAQ